MPAIQEALNLGRAKNLVQEYLIRKLLFPKIFFDAQFNGKHVDVLAIDRFGTGDVHSVHIVYLGSDPENALDLVLANSLDVSSPGVIPHFIYAAVVNQNADSGKFAPSERFIERSFSEDGVGRLGILYVDLTGENPSIKVVLKPERFRSSKEIVALADQFVATHTPNWEVRE